MKIGDRISIALPPKLTLVDRILWRLFRIARKRKPVKQELIVNAVSAG